MTTSLLYHAFCVRSYSLLRTEYRDGSVYAHLQKKRYARRCAACQYPGVTLEGCAEVKVRTLPIGKRRVFLVLHLHRLRCRRCGKLKQEPRDIAAPRKSYSLALARLVLDLCQQMTLSAVAQYLQLNWHVCKDILLSDLSRTRRTAAKRTFERAAVERHCANDVL
jgi:transposase